MNYSLEKGLSSSQVNYISQDKLGYLWVGTQSGLSRFDGTYFVNFSLDDGLPDNKIEKLLIDDNQQLWVATPRGLAKQNGSGFQTYLFPDDHNLDTRINSICSDGADIYVASDSGLIRLRDEAYEYLAETEDDKIKIRDVIGHKGSIYCASSRGVYRWSDGQLHEPLNELLDTINASDLFLFENKLYVATYGDGIIIYNLENEDYEQIYEGVANVRMIYADEEVLLGARRTGAVEIKDDQTFRYRTSNGLLNENIKAVFRDREGNIWIGSDGNGLYKFTGRSVISYFEEDGMSSDLVMSISQLPDCTYVFGTYNAGITMMDQAGKFSYFDRENGLKSNQVWVINVDRRGDCLVGTSDGVDALSHGSLAYDERITEVDEKTRSIIEVGRRLYVSGGTNGIKVFSNNEEVNTNFRNGLDVYKLLASKNNVYVGSSNGLFVFDATSPSPRMKQISLPDDNVQALCLDDKDNLWIGTDNGLFYYPNEKEIVAVTLDETEFRSKNVVALISDHNGDIWASTYNGVYQLSDLDTDKMEYDLLHYGLAEGLVHLEGNLNALYEDHEHQIWVGTSGGLSRIDPSQNDLLFDFEKPQLHIRGMRLFMEDFDYDKYNSEKDELTGVPVEITLPYNQNHLTFDFVGMNFKDPSNVKYSYRLVGVSDVWSPVSTSNYATYSFINPGSYTFEVMAANRNMEWSEVQRIKITILPPFWQTWWFILIIIVLIFMIIVLIFQVRIRAFKQKQENERLNFKNRLLFLEQRSLNASMNRHFIFNSLNSIQYFINSSDRISANKYLSSFAKLIRKNLDSSTANNFVVTLQEEVERIELYLALEKMRFHDKFDYTLDIDQNIDSEEVEIPSMIMQPFVENSIIHGVLPLDRTGHITVSIYEKEGEIIFEIEDDGIGIDKSLSQKKSAVIDGDHESKGMEITNRRIELLRKLTGENLSIEGPFQMNDENGNSLGSKVVIRIGIEDQAEDSDFAEDLA